MTTNQLSCLILIALQPCHVIASLLFIALTGIGCSQQTAPARASSPHEMHQETPPKEPAPQQQAPRLETEDNLMTLSDYPCKDVWDDRQVSKQFRACADSPANDQPTDKVRDGMQEVPPLRDSTCMPTYLMLTSLSFRRCQRIQICISETSEAALACMANLVCELCAQGTCEQPSGMDIHGAGWEQCMRELDTMPCDRLGWPESCVGELRKAGISVPPR